MCAHLGVQQFLGGVNVLTGPTDEHWKAVRKGVSPAFSAQRMREACHTVAYCALRLVDIIADSPQEPRNIDNLLLRESMDVIGDAPFADLLGMLAAVERQCWLSLHVLLAIQLRMHIRGAVVLTGPVSPSCIR